MFVTHEISAAAEFARTVVLLDGEKKYFALGPVREVVTSETMSALYGRPVEVRREDERDTGQLLCQGRSHARRLACATSNFTVLCGR